MADLTEKQHGILLKFKECLKDVAKPEYDDRFYSRWLIARDFDIPKAEKMFKQSLMWRSKYGVDSIMEWDAPEILKYYYPTGYHGEAKDGTPLYFFLVGRIDCKPLYYGARKQDFVKKMARNFIYLDTVLGPAQSVKHGKRIDQMTVIQDFEGLGLDILWKPFLDLSRDVVKYSDENFPERLSRAILINLPRFFPILWNIAKPVLSRKTKEKVILLGSNWKREILEYVDEDQLPAHWGGTAPDPPALPETDYSFCWGGKVPDKYKNTKPEIDTSKFTTHHVGRGSSFYKDVTITVPNSIIEWQFWSEDHDIGFGIYRRTDAKQSKKEEMEIIYKCERVNSHILPESGSFPCDTPGTYVVIFDNSYSWARGKSIAYCIQVYEPTSLGDVGVNTQTVDTHL